MKKKVFTIFLIFFFTIMLSIIYSKFLKKDKLIEINQNDLSDTSINSNIIRNVIYESKDAKGNEYIINAVEGEIDYANTDIIFLTDVRALIKLNNSSKNITITSDYGKYNINNYDTIFSKNVIINYLDNKITGEYLDFSIKRSSMIISRNVVYFNLENILKADVVEVDIVTKDTKIFMYKNNKKVNIKSKN